MQYLTEEDSVLMNGEIDQEQSRSQRGAEHVAIHQSYLCADGLVLEEVLLWRDHVSEDFSMRLYDLGDGLVGDLGQ